MPDFKIHLVRPVMHTAKSPLLWASTRSSTGVIMRGNSLFGLGPYAIQLLLSPDSCEHKSWITED